MTITRRRVLQAAMTTASVGLMPRAAPAQGTTALRIGYVPVLGAAPLLVLAKSGMAKGVGLDIELTKLDPVAPGLPPDTAFEALAIGVGPLARAHSAGSTARVIVSLATAGAGFVARPALAARFYAGSGDPAVAFALFKAKFRRPATMATTAPGIVPSVLLHRWLFKSHTVPRDLIDIEVMALDAMQAAILDGSVDAATLPEPMSTIARTRDPSLQRIISGSAMFPDMPGVVLAVPSRFADEHPSACRALVRGLVAAVRMTRDNPFKAAPHVQDGLGLATADLPQVTRALASSNIAFVTDPRAIEGAAKEMLAYEVERGDLAEVPPIASLFDDRFYPGGPF